MVFFTCNACGQSLKKSHVEKHFASQCRNCEVLACMDCGKDFWGEEYKNHVKCISEEEKYSGKDFKAKANKGEEKQESWTQLIQTTIDTATNLAPDLLNFLKQLVVYTNVPRKQAKFENFVRNSMRIRNENLISRAWEVFNTAHKSASKKKEESNPTPNTGDAEPVLTQNEDAVKKEKKKKKSKTGDDLAVVGDIPAASTEELINKSNSSIKKKHKKRKHTEVNDEKLDEAVPKETSVSSPMELAEVEGKHKKKRKSASGEDKTNENGETAGECMELALDEEATQPKMEEDGKKKSKKRKSGNTCEEQVLNGISPGKEGNEEGKKHKKRKSVDAEQDVSSPMNENEVTELMANGKEEMLCSSSKKHKKDKKRNKREAGETEQLKVQEVVADENDGNSPNAFPKSVDESAKKTKKSKKKSLGEGETGQDEDKSQNLDSKLDKHESTNNVGAGNENNVSTPGSQKSSKFKWSKVAEKLLLETPEKQLSLKKMKKKIFAEYFSQNSEESEEIKQQLEDKFVAKVIKNTRFEVEDKQVRLVV